MKRLLQTAFFAFVVGFFALHAPPNASAQNADAAKKKAVVLLELFTSEGCPSCPPADANLAFLEREQPFADTEIVTLALHVDYWNSVNWKDAYSSPVFSRRQQIYSQALKTNQSYTPQMIVDGQWEFTGNNMAKAQRAILEAMKTQKATIAIAPAGRDKISVKIADVPAHNNATVFLAVTEDRLGANRKGAKQTESGAGRMSVVRHLGSLGMLAPAQDDLEIETVLPTERGWKRENLKLVVFVQDNNSRRILGATRQNLP